MISIKKSKKLFKNNKIRLRISFDSGNSRWSQPARPYPRDSVVERSLHARGCDSPRELVGTEIRTVDFRLNKENRRTLVSQRSRISANTTRQAIRTRNENSNKIRNRKREQDSSYSESAFERLQQGRCLGYESCRRDS